MNSMRTVEWLTIAALVLSPIFAVQAQKWIERFKEKKGRKNWAFQVLMSTRMAKLSANHVEALNLIDFIFDKKKKKEKPVIDAWKTYRDHLGALGEKPTEIHLQTWTETKDSLFVDLLYEMSKVVGYDCDKVELRRSAYAPKAHEDTELEFRIIRQSLVSILTGETPIPIRVDIGDDAQKKQNALGESIQEFYDGKRTIRVIVENPEAIKKG